MFSSTYTRPDQHFFPYPVPVSHLQVSLHLLVGDPEEGLTGPRVAEAARAHMNVVQTGHSVHLTGTEELL